MLVGIAQQCEIFFSMLQKDAYKQGTRILNSECVVLLLGNNKLAISLDATFNTISRLERKAVDNVFHMKVVLVPYNRISKTPPIYFVMACMISLRI